MFLTRFADSVTLVHRSDTLRGTITGEQSQLDATGLFIAIGHDPCSELVLGQVDVNENNYVLVKHPITETNLPGVFACGDLVDHRYWQAITAAGTGCAAALDAEHYLATHGLVSAAQTAQLDEVRN